MNKKTILIAALMALLFTTVGYAQSRFSYSERGPWGSSSTSVTTRINPGVGGYGYYQPPIANPGTSYYSEWDGVSVTNGATSMDMGTMTITPVFPPYRRGFR